MPRETQREDPAHGKSILVLEDDPTIRLALAELFKMEGFAAEMAEHGMDALRRIKNGYRPCLIILDLMMPNMDGIQFMDEIRRIPGAADTPVVVLSGDGRAKEKIAGRKVAETITKPVDIDRLIDLARRYC
ncbi:MAG TPA: response regulator [Bdellovibrionota bacterium]|nr:response regulator [Bdellovibrionota bacterium]